VDRRAHDRFARRVVDHHAEEIDVELAVHRRRRDHDLERELDPWSERWNAARVELDVLQDHVEVVLLVGRRRDLAATFDIGLRDRHLSPRDLRGDPQGDSGAGHGNPELLEDLDTQESRLRARRGSGCVLAPRRRDCGGRLG
jgi:hypothetical protein